jgi:hypothetical protein
LHPRSLLFLRRRRDGRETLERSQRSSPEKYIHISRRRGAESEREKAKYTFAEREREREGCLKSERASGLLVI